MGFERYVDYALDVPMYFVKRGDATSTCRPVVPRPARRQAEAAARRARHAFPTGPTTSTIFPEVRLKRYIEMRGADGGPWRRLPALPAFWVGLLYDDAALDACWEIVKDWTADGSGRSCATTCRQGDCIPGRSADSGNTETASPDRTAAETAPTLALV
jgi:glutamate--cysteine ligase